MGFPACLRNEPTWPPPRGGSARRLTGLPSPGALRSAECHQWSARARTLRCARRGAGDSGDSWGRWPRSGSASRSTEHTDQRMLELDDHPPREHVLIRQRLVREVDRSGRDAGLDERLDPVGGVASRELLLEQRDQRRAIHVPLCVGREARVVAERLDAEHLQNFSQSRSLPTAMIIVLSRARTG